MGVVGVGAFSVPAVLYGQQAWLSRCYGYGHRPRSNGRRDPPATAVVTAMVVGAAVVVVGPAVVGGGAVVTGRDGAEAMPVCITVSLRKPSLLLAGAPTCTRYFTAGSNPTVTLPATAPAHDPPSTPSGTLHSPSTPLAPASLTSIAAQNDDPAVDICTSQAPLLPAPHPAASSNDNHTSPPPVKSPADSPAGCVQAMG